MPTWFGACQRRTSVGETGSATVTVTVAITSTAIASPSGDAGTVVMQEYDILSYIVVHLPNQAGVRGISSATGMGSSSQQPSQA